MEIAAHARKGSGTLTIKGHHFGRTPAHVITAVVVVGSIGHSFGLKPFGNVF